MAIEPGERVCFIGRNGAGKSTTLKLITGEIEPDRGQIIHKTGLVVSQLAQALPDAMEFNVHDFVRSGLAETEKLLARYHELSAQDLDDKDLLELELLHQQIDSHDGWHLEQRVETTMTELNLPAEKMMSELSGGWRRRVALAKALVTKPDLLLLDEPTNHLDVVTIKWLENIIFSYAGSVLFITHDRAFLNKLATRIIEIDRGKLTSWPGNFENFERRKEKALEDEETENARFDKRLDKEEVWIRQGIKARRTRNEGRVRTLKKMREDRANRIARGPNARIHIEEGEQSGRKVIRARNVFYGYENEPLVDDFSVKIMRGDRIGILGNNGVGKTTLLRLLLGDLEPQSGTIKHGTNLEVGYFDQLRQTLDPEKSVAENVGGGKPYIHLNGKDRHIVGYLKGFLFGPKRSMTPVKSLSGGERNRVILAKLFTRPANLLVLDEPTNDLDMETLEILEHKLINFSGTLIVVSHDRQFLDNVVTSTIVFEENTSIREYVGGYSDWLRQGHDLTEVDNPLKLRLENDAREKASRKQAPSKLSYKDQRLLDDLPAEIEALETLINDLETKISASDFYAQGHECVQKDLDLLSVTKSTLDQRMDVWSELADRQQAYEQSRNSG